MMIIDKTIEAISNRGGRDVDDNQSEGRGRRYPIGAEANLLGTESRIEAAERSRRRKRFRGRHSDSFVDRFQRVQLSLQAPPLLSNISFWVFSPFISCSLGLATLHINIKNILVDFNCFFKIKSYYFRSL